MVWFWLWRDIVEPWCQDWREEQARLHNYILSGCWVYFKSYGEYRHVCIVQQVITTAVPVWWGSCQQGMATFEYKAMSAAVVEESGEISTEISCMSRERTGYADFSYAQSVMMNGFGRCGYHFIVLLLVYWQVSQRHHYFPSIDATGIWPLIDFEKFFLALAYANRERNVDRLIWIVGVVFDVVTHGCRSVNTAVDMKST